LAASPLAFLFLVVVLAGLAVTRRPRRAELALPAAVIGSALLGEVVLMRLFPESGRFPYHPEQLVLALSFSLLGALMTRPARNALPLLGLFLVYSLACVFSFAIPTDLGSNVERLRYAAIPLALLAVSIAGWRPLAVALPLLAVAGFWNVKPLIANYQRAASDPAASVQYWQPAISYLHEHLGASYRVEVVDTLEHWPAVYFPEAGVPIVRGWYRQNDFPANELLYDEQLGPRAYQRWLRSLGVKYVVLSEAPPDYSSRAEAQLLRSGGSGLRPVFYSPTAMVYEVPQAAGVVTGPAPVPSTSWPSRPRSPWSSSSRRSGPASRGSVITFDPDSLTARRAELEQQMGEPGFWDDQERAARISTEHARVTRKLDRYERLLRDYDDARELLSLDGGMEEEIARSLQPLQH